MNFDLAAFMGAPATEQVPPAIDPNLPESVQVAPRDSDGNPIPFIWQESKRWVTLTPEIRKRWSDVWVAEEIKAEAARRMHKPKPTRAPAPTYTTQYAVDWVGRQKKPSGLAWSILDREHFDARTKRHHDLMLGVDLLCEDGTPGMIGIQAAGKGERAVHYQRFLDRGGPEKAKHLGIRVYYQVYERGNKEPLETERWA